MESPLRWVSIDPGDRHVGFATWQGDTCLHAIELTPDECIKALENFLDAGILEAIVYEKFALYGWNEKSMAGNEFLTSQLIGIIKYLANRHDVQCVGQFASEHKRIYRMGWYKELTAKEQRQMPWWGNGGHAKDAWCVGAWFVRQRKVAA
jgi:hypothetical protein